MLIEFSKSTTMHVISKKTHPNYYKRMGKIAMKKKLLVSK